MTVVLRPDDLAALCRSVLARACVLPAVASSLFSLTMPSPPAMIEIVPLPIETLSFPTMPSETDVTFRDTLVTTTSSLPTTPNL